MPSRKPKLDAERLYTPISAFARGYKVFNPEMTQLRGDDPAVKAAPELWIAVDATTPAKQAARQAKMAAALAPVPEAPDPNRPKVLEQRVIPATRRVIARDAFWKGSTFVPRGAARDINDAIVKAAPEMFDRVVPIDDPNAPRAA